MNELRPRDQLVLLMNQSLFSGESLSQLDFRAPTSDQLAFAVSGCAVLLALLLEPARWRLWDRKHAWHWLSHSRYLSLGGWSLTVSFFPRRVT